MKNRIFTTIGKVISSTVNIVIAIAVIIIILLLWLLFNKSNTITNLENIVTVNNRTIHNYRDSNDKLNSRVKTLNLTNTKLLNDLDKTDSTLNRLRLTAEEYETRNRRLLAAIITSNNILVQYKDSLNNLITSIDTIVDNNITYLYPTYTRDLDMFNDWIFGTITLGRTTTELDIKVRSEYDISIYRERKNIFSSYNTYANIKINNPYDTTEDFVVFYKEEKKNRFNVSISTGFDLISRNPIIGITIGYTVITF